MSPWPCTSDPTEPSSLTGSVAAGGAALGTDLTKPAPNLSCSPRAVTHMKGFVHRGWDKQATCSLPQGTRHKVIKPWNSFSDISIGEFSQNIKKDPFIRAGLQDELQELLCVHPLLEVLTCPSDLKIHAWVLFTVQS